MNATLAAANIVAAAWLFGGIVSALFAVSTVAFGFAARLTLPMFWLIVNWSAAVILALTVLRHAKGGP